MFNMSQKKLGHDFIQTHQRFWENVSAWRLSPNLEKKQIWAGNILLLQTKNFQIPTPCHLEPLFFKTFPNPGNPR